MAEKKKSFNIAELMTPADVSNSDTLAPTLELIDIDAIESNENNFYELSNLQPLADSILMDGLQQPLLVISSPDDPAKVRLISGHRRRAAIKMLVEDEETPRPELRKIPCIRKAYASAAMAELQLILANSTSREMTPAEKMKQAEKTEMLLYQLKEEGYSFPGRMRDQVAAACNSSASKLARLKVIRENLIPHYMSFFKNGKLSESVAYEIARLRPEYQEKIPEMKVYKDIKCLNCYNVPGIGNTLAKYFGPAIKCQENPDPVTGTIGYCTHGAVMWERSKNESYNSCSGCCSLCYSRKSCKFVCPIVVPKIEKEKAADSEKVEKNKVEKAETAAAWDKFIKTTWTRIKEMRAAAGVDVETIISEAEAIAKSHGQNFWISWEAEDWTEAEQLKDYYDDTDIFNIDLLTAMANLFHCSIDYLVCRCNDPTPGAPAGWRLLSKDPPAEGQKIIVLDKGGPMMLVDVWIALVRNGAFTVPDDAPYDITANMADRAIGWMPFPEVP